MSDKVFLCIDYGQKRIGLAYATASLAISLPIGYIETKPTLALTAAALYKIIQERKVSHVVLGNPIPMRKHQRSPLQEEIHMLAELLREMSGLEVVLWDERLSSAQAERELRYCGYTRRQRKNKSDAIAATLILTSFLETL